MQPKLGARVRLLATGNVNKNDPNDARSVAVAALRSPGVREARPDDHAAVRQKTAPRKLIMQKSVLDTAWPVSAAGPRLSHFPTPASRERRLSMAFA